MARHKNLSLEELKVKAKTTDYYFNKYRKELEKKQRREEIKAENFEEFLKEESAKCVLGFNPYQE